MKDPKVKFSRNQALSLYKQLILPRAIEERMLILLRQNKISKWFSGIGQEAIAVGTAFEANSDDYIMTMHRNLGVFTTRNVPLYPLFCQLFVRRDGFSEGRERSFHFGLLPYRIVGMISHLAAMIPVADGLALAAQLRNEKRVAFAFTGDGATSEGDFHEALNLAAVWKLPMVCIIENNGYGLSTPSNEQYACENLADRALGYGMEQIIVDGNDVLAVIGAIKKARKLALQGKPVLLEARTFRMRGHEEASGTAYVPKKLMEEWAKKDPIIRFEAYLCQEHGFTPESLQELKNAAAAQILPDIQRALDCPPPVFDASVESAKVYAEVGNHPDAPISALISDEVAEQSEFRYVDGIRHALASSMEQDDKTIIIGQDIAEYGGVFKVTAGFLEAYGKSRIRNTPIIESGAIGAAYGLALEGFRPVVEMQFSDFISCGFNQIINNVAKSHYRWSPAVNVTIRAPYGGGVGAGPFHSQCPEGWFMQHPGLKIAVPATVEDAQILLWSALQDPNPTIIFEHKKLYRSLRGPILRPIPFEALGKARVHRPGSDATIVTYGMGVHWAAELAHKQQAESGVSVEIVDLRCLVPLDTETIFNSVRKTGRVLLLQEPSQFLGPMSEIAAMITEHCFEALDAPVLRCSSLDTPVPTSTVLENGYLASARIEETFAKLMQY
jgi:2-oxoisovalerate dehydrogenase E1 component